MLSVQNVTVRIILYVLSPLLTALVTMLPGWGLEYQNGVLLVDVEMATTAVVAALAGGLGLSAWIFSRWGTR